MVLRYSVQPIGRPLPFLACNPTLSSLYWNLANGEIADAGKRLSDGQHVVVSS